METNVTSVTDCLTGKKDDDSNGLSSTRLAQMALAAERRKNAAHGVSRGEASKIRQPRRGV